MIGRVRDIMERPRLVARLGDSVHRIRERMGEQDLGGIPVVDDDDRVVGVVTGRKLTQAHPNRLIADVMTADLTLSATTSLWEAAAHLSAGELGRLPVVENERLIGVIDRCRVAQEMASQTDSLTGLPSGQFLRAKTEEFLRYGLPFSLLFLDIDEFGAVNKRLGHANGDWLLRMLGDALRITCQEGSDYPCRFGGDEFAVLSRRERIALTALASELQDAFRHRGVSVSMGLIALSDVPDLPESLHPVWVDRLLNEASLASTRAKRTPGRLCVIAPLPDILA